MNYIYAALAIALVGIGWYGGSLRTKSVMARQAAATAQTVAAQEAKQLQHTDAEEARLNGLVKQYEDASLTPVAAGTADRLFKYITIHSCPVSSPSATAGGVVSPAGVPASDPEVERLSQGAFDAAGRDSLRLGLCQQAWPR